MQCRCHKVACSILLVILVILVPRPKCLFQMNVVLSFTSHRVMQSLHHKRNSEINSQHKWCNPTNEA